MPTTNENLLKIKAAQSGAASKVKEAGQLSAGATSLFDNVMTGVRKDRATRGVSQMATDVGNVMGQMVSDPAGIRERTSGMVAPGAVNRLTSGARAQNLRTLGTTATQAEYNKGTMKDIVEGYASQLQAQAQAKAAEAQTMLTEADNLYKQLYYEQSEKEREFNEYMQRAKLDVSGRAGKTTGIGPRGEYGDEETQASSNAFAQRAMQLRQTIDWANSMGTEEGLFEDIAGWQKDILEGNITSDQAMAQFRTAYPSLEGEALQTAVFGEGRAGKLGQPYEPPGWLKTWSAVHESPLATKVRGLFTKKPKSQESW